jgi:hypothetical protein
MLGAINNLRVNVDISIDIDPSMMVMHDSLFEEEAKATSNDVSNNKNNNNRRGSLKGKVPNKDRNRSLGHKTLMEVSFVLIF